MTPEELHEIHQYIDRAANRIADPLRLHSIFDEAIKKAAGQWQPIETAPKDGLVMLLYPCGMFGTVSPDVGYWDRDKGYEAWRTLDGERIEPMPTHWMPLPDPPSAIRARTNGDEK